MDPDQMKNTAWYAVIADPMKVATAIYYHDQDDKGISFSQIKEILNDDVTPTSVSRGLDYLMDTFQVEQKSIIKDGYLIQVYTLDSIFREVLQDFIKE